MAINNFITRMLAAGLFLVCSIMASADETVHGVLKADDYGLYKVTHPQLLSKGIDLSGIETTRIGLYKGGRRSWGVRVVGQTTDRSIFGVGGYLLFASYPRLDRYNDDARYTIKVDSAISPNHANIDALPVASGGVYAGHWNNIYSDDFVGYHSDSPYSLPYYAQRLTTYDAGNSSHDITIDLDNPRTGNGNAVVNLYMWGGNRNGSHSYTVRVNGTPVGSGSFFDENYHRGRYLFPRSILNNGTNTVTVTNVVGEGYSRFYVGRANIGVSYDHEAKDNAITFYQPTRTIARPHRIKGFATPAVLVVKQSGFDQVYYTKDSAIQEADGTYTVKVPGAAQGGRYFVSSWAALKVPEILPPDYTNDQNARYSTNADVFLIAPSDFIDTAPLAQLSDALSASAGVVKTVSLESIYDEYHNADGRVRPHAISAFIRHAVKRKGGKSFVLVGGESHDQLDRLGLGSFSIIPTHYVETANMRQTPSDSKYGDIDYDNVPDVPVSRLPVFTLDGLQAVVTKSIAFMNQQARSHLFISDKNDTFNANYSFLTDSQQIGSVLTGGEQQLSLQTTSIAPLRSGILDRMNTGDGVINYVGHSSLTKFGLHDTIFDDVDAAGLTNYGKPFVVNMLGCNSNDYTLPSSTSLGQSLMTGNGTAGAAAVVGQTARVVPQHSTLLAKHYYSRLSEGLSIGEALVNAQQQFAADQGNDLSRHDVLLGTSLLGLPTHLLPQ